MSILFNVIVSIEPKLAQPIRFCLRKYHAPNNQNEIDNF